MVRGKEPGQCFSDWYSAFVCLKKEGKEREKKERKTPWRDRNLNLKGRPGNEDFNKWDQKKKQQQKQNIKLTESGELWGETAMFI